MLSAEKAGMTPEDLIGRMREEHQRDSVAFSIDHANYWSTHSEENREITSLIYQRLKDAGHINRRTIEQLYDPEKEMFLPDRFIRGECPNCHAHRINMVTNVRYVIKHIHRWI